MRHLSPEPGDQLLEALLPAAPVGEKVAAAVLQHVRSPLRTAAEDTVPHNKEEVHDQLAMGARVVDVRRLLVELSGLMRNDLTWTPETSTGRYLSTTAADRTPPGDFGYFAFFLPPETVPSSVNTATQ